ncbi:putative uncharacterized protein DDB_G0282133 [Gordionus sp. m RMFG-2023]|uniref:putative uncharacterized protein DDB_G0282133 n=1 Tax=Gordionus sp. m RMFG-2023 TaxID=3053472 RepID=UPI0031FBB737
MPWIVDIWTFKCNLNNSKKSKFKFNSNNINNEKFIPKDSKTNSSKFHQKFGTFKTIFSYSNEKPKNKLISNLNKFGSHNSKKLDIEFLECSVKPSIKLEELKSVIEAKKLHSISMPPYTRSLTSSMIHNITDVIEEKNIDPYSIYELKHKSNSNKINGHELLNNIVPESKMGLLPAYIIDSKKLTTINYKNIINSNQYIPYFNSDNNYNSNTLKCNYNSKNKMQRIQHTYDIPFDEPGTPNNFKKDINYKVSSENNYDLPWESLTYTLTTLSSSSDYLPNLNKIRHDNKNSIKSDYSDKNYPSSIYNCYSNINNGKDKRPSNEYNAPWNNLYLPLNNDYERINENFYQNSYTLPRPRLNLLNTSKRNCPQQTKQHQHRLYNNTSINLTNRISPTPTNENPEKKNKICSPKDQSPSDIDSALDNDEKEDSQTDVRHSVSSKIKLFENRSTAELLGTENLMTRSLILPHRETAKIARILRKS